MRKTVDITIETEGRDKGKVFRITEMPAFQAERWATKALMAVARAGIDIGEVVGMGMQGIATLGLNALLSVNYEDVEPLLNEMMVCVKIVRDPKRPTAVFDIIPETDIEEVGTILQIRRAIIEIHTSFSQAGSPSNSTSEAPASPQPSSTMPTSPQPSVKFSQSPPTRRTR